MRIYKISAEQIIPQNPSGQPDPNIALQNMQNAAASIGDIDAIIEAVNQLNTAINAVDEALGGDSGIKQEIQPKLTAIITNNAAVKLLMQMNLLPNIETLFNAGEFDRIKVKITNDIVKIQEQISAQSIAQNVKQKTT